MAGTRKISDEEASARQREAKRVWAEKKRAAGNEIGELPPALCQKERSDCELDFRRFCEFFYNDVFSVAWSEDHLRVLEKTQRAILTGGLFALAMPRGSGKTSIAEAGCVWAMVYGHRKFIVLIGADTPAATDMLDSIKAQLETNDRLAEAFPEICYPISKIEGVPIRAHSQTYQGKRTAIGWNADEIVLPDIPGAPGACAIIRARGITSRIRGMKFTRRDGTTVRPDAVVVDDPQTDESARSAAQSAARESILSGAILGLAGPGKTIAGIMPCTVIEPGDLADNMVNKDKHPEWNGERTKLIYEFPDDDALWEQYARIRTRCLHAGDTQIREATEFYRHNRDAMDAGAKAAWPERHHDYELSAVQHAINLKLRDERTFYAEYQNEPGEAAEDDEINLTSEQIAAKVNRLDRGLIPIEARALTAFVDIQKKALFYVVCAWADQFTGWIIDYGCWPEQRKSYFTLRDIRATMQSKLPGAGLEAQIYNGLEKLADHLLDRSWKKDDGSLMTIQRMPIDANWEQSTDVIHQFCRQSKYRDRVMPAHGRYYGASTMPMNSKEPKPGEIVGHNWRVPPLGRGRSVRHLLFDANFWKTFVFTRLAVPMGDRGCLSLWGRSTTAHRLFGDHLTAEYRVRTQGRGRTVDEWKLRPERGDNHWFDGIVGSAVAASMCGVTMREWTSLAPKRRKSRRKRGVFLRQ